MAAVAASFSVEKAQAAVAERESLAAAAPWYRLSGSHVWGPICSPPKPRHDSGLRAELTVRNVLGGSTIPLVFFPLDSLLGVGVHYLAPMAPQDRTASFVIKKSRGNFGTSPPTHSQHPGLVPHHLHPSSALLPPVMLPLGHGTTFLIYGNETIQIHFTICKLLFLKQRSLIILLLNVHKSAEPLNLTDSFFFNAAQFSCKYSIQWNLQTMVKVYWNLFQYISITCLKLGSSIPYCVVGSSNDQTHKARKLVLRSVKRRLKLSSVLCFMRSS